MTTYTPSIETDVIIIGGGATGAGIARDVARRGLRTILLERHDIATGATGRNHGLLHSGARYAVTDPMSAHECIKENNILKHIARHCIEATDGLFLTLPEDDLADQAGFIAACQAAGINAQAIDTKDALRLEPSANPNMLGAVIVPDGTVDPFRLTAANMLDAQEHGAQVLTYHEVIGLIRQNDRIVGVQVHDHYKKHTYQIRAEIVVNACGIWGQKIARYADIEICMFPTKGSLLILEHRINNMVLNRCRKPADADILVPGDTISLIGTTSTRIPYDQIDNMLVTPQEVEILIREGEKLSPKLRQTRILRAYAGVRPLIAADNDPSGRNISRGIVLFDHAERDGLEGFITITGGKLMTYRLMAELATDKVCEKLHHHTKCTTAEHILPGSEQKTKPTIQKLTSLPPTIVGSIINRHGDRAARVLHNTNSDNSLVCECEAVSVGEVRYAIESLSVNNLIDLRRRTRVGMGTCQGEICACRSAGLLNRFNVTTPQQSLTQLRDFLNERWQGIRPIAWGNALKESEFTSWTYQNLCGLQEKEDAI